ncbi:MAG: hypothetical protein Q8M03_07620 [Legionella sp.]|nr:hypothetical protein [Legionella sp.]
MTKIKQIKGNYKEALDAVELPAAFAKEASYDAAVTSLFEDLKRAIFVESHGKTFDDFISTWMDSNVSKTYSQGNMDAGFFDLIKLHFLLSPSFIKEGTDRTEEKRQQYLNGPNNQALKFAYYDDDAIPCGVSIAFSGLDSGIWTATIIRNTPASPEERQVMIIGSEDLLDGSNVETNSKVIIEFLNFLKSGDGQEIPMSMEELHELTPEKFKEHSIKKLLTGILLEDGRVDLARLTILSDKIKPGISNEHKEKIATKEEHVRIIKKQFDKHANIDAKMDDFKAKDAESKRSKEAAIKSWYETELQKLNEFKNSELDAARKQPFIKRNAGNLTLEFIAVVAAVGLVLTALLAPVGLPLLVSLFVGAVGASFLALGGAKKIADSEKKLTEYEQQINELPGKQKALSAKRREIYTEVHAEFKPREEEFIKSLEGPFEVACRECLARDDLTTEEVIAWSKDIFPVANEIEAEGSELNLIEDDLPVIDPRKMDMALEDGQSLVSHGLSIQIKPLPLPVVNKEMLPETAPSSQEVQDQIPVSHGQKANKQ